MDLYHGLAEVERKRKAAGMGYGYGKPQVAWGMHGASVNQVKRGKGKRAWGAGPKRWLKPIWEGVKEWFNHERQNGMFVDRTDAFLELHERVKLYHQEVSERVSAGRMLTKLERRCLSQAAEHLRVVSPKHKRC